MTATAAHHPSAAASPRPTAGSTTSPRWSTSPPISPTTRTPTASRRTCWSTTPRRCARRPRRRRPAEVEAELVRALTDGPGHRRAPAAPSPTRRSSTGRRPRSTRSSPTSTPAGAAAATTSPSPAPTTGSGTRWRSWPCATRTRSSTTTRNDMIALISRAWLGPGYQVTSQVNVVRPGGQAQDPHRDYHLGFLSNDVAAQYPTHVHLLSPVLTLQGAVAHSDMPVESGPTMYLPYSHQYDARLPRLAAAGVPRATSPTTTCSCRWPRAMRRSSTRRCSTAPAPTSRADIQRDGQPAPGLLGVRPRDGDRRPRQGRPGRSTRRCVARTAPGVDPTLVATRSRRPPRATRSRPTSTSTNPSTG